MRKESSCLWCCLWFHPHFIWIICWLLCVTDQYTSWDDELACYSSHGQASSPLPLISPFYSIFLFSLPPLSICTVVSCLNVFPQVMWEAGRDRLLSLSFSPSLTLTQFLNCPHTQLDLHHETKTAADYFSINGEVISDSLIRYFLGSISPNQSKD